MRFFIFCISVVFDGEIFPRTFEEESNKMTPRDHISWRKKKKEMVDFSGGTRQGDLDTIITVIITTKDQGLAIRLATSSRFRDTRIIPIRHSTIIGTGCEVQDSNDNFVEENTVQR